MFKTEKLLNIKEASIWATEHIGKTVTPSNIAYLINYGRVEKRGGIGNRQIQSLTASQLKNYGTNK